MKYIAFIYKEDNDYVAVVPDFGFTSSYGETFEEACEMIREASELYCEDLDNLPQSSSLETLLARTDLDLPKDAIHQLIDITLNK